LAVARQLAGQVYTFLKQYAVIYGDLLEPIQFAALAAKFQNASTETDYRDFVAQVKVIARQRWTTFDNGLMILGIVLFVGALISPATGIIMSVLSERESSTSFVGIILVAYCLGPLSRSFVIHQVGLV
jgi:polysaccharide pyruvyl transferase WcaK-like protein